MEKSYGQNLNEQNLIYLITVILVNKFQILTMDAEEVIYQIISTSAISWYSASFKMLPAELVDNQGGSKAGEE